VSEDVYKVEGMTCAHCVAAVTEEVGRIPGAAAVQVDLETGTLAVHGEGVARDDVKAAVEEAGYSLV
jgi:copper chaperone CopZ